MVTGLGSPGPAFFRSFGSRPRYRIWSTHLAYCAVADREEDLHEVARRTREVLGLRRYGLRATPP